MRSHRTSPLIHNLALFLVAAILLQPARGAADTPLNGDSAIYYLNEQYIGNNWDIYADYMANGIIQSVDRSIPGETFGLCTLDSSSLNLSKAPWFEHQDGGGGLEVRIPAANFTPRAVRDNYHYMHITLDCGAFGMVDAWMYFAVNGVITASNATFSVDFKELEFADVLASTLDVGEWLKDLIKDAATGELDINMAAFMRMRWDPALTVPNATIDWHAGAPSDLPEESVVDILLVADGYTAATMPDYEAVIDTIAAEFLNSADPERTEPYSNFPTAMRLWTMARPVPDSEVGLGMEFSPYRLLGAYKDKTSTKATFNNAGMLSLLPYGYDVTVVVADAREMGGSDIRANAVGRFVSLPTYGTADNSAAAIKIRAKTANPFMLELGHTPLGNLTDEYQRRDELYRGNEPVSVNVSTNEHSIKWQHHTDRDPQLGGYNYSSGVWRPYPTCRMRDSFMSGEGERQNAFCPVCRESLTRNIYEHVDMYPFLVTYYEAQWPFRSSGREESIASESHNKYDFADLYTVTGTEDGTRTVLGIRGASLPEPWNVKWTITREDSSATSPDVIVGNEIMVDLYPDDVIDLSVTTTNDFVRDPDHRGYTPIIGRLTTKAQIAFPGGPPSPPLNLTVQPDEDPIPNVYAPDTGIATSALRLWARPGCYAKFTYRCSTEWNVSEEGGGEELTLFSTPTTHGDGMAEDMHVGYLSEGSYTARARSAFTATSGEVQTSDWVSMESSFHMGPLAFTTEPQPPHDPVLMRTSSCDDHALLSATTWDANGDPFRLEFEVRPGGVPFQGDADPAALLSTEQIGEGLTASADLLSLRFEGQVRFENTAGGPYDWQVRSVDSSGAAGPWSRGPSFFLGAFSDCSIRSAQQRLADSLGQDKQLLTDIIDTAWINEPEFARPDIVPCVGYLCEPFALVAGHLFDRLEAEPPVSLMRKLPAAISAALTGKEIDAPTPPTTPLKYAWKQAMGETFGEGKDLFESSLAAGVPAIFFAETSHLESDLKTGLVTAMVTVHAVNIKEDKITSVTALGTALLGESATISLYALEPRSFSEVEAAAIINGAYLATLQLQAEITGTAPKSTLIPAPPPTPTASPDAGPPPPADVDTGSADGCLCNAGDLAGDSTPSWALQGLMVLGLLYWRRRRTREE